MDGCLFKRTKTATATVSWLAFGKKGTKISLVSSSGASHAASSQNESFSSASKTFFLRNTIRPSLRPYSLQSGMHTRRQEAVQTTRTIRRLSGQLQKWLDWQSRRSLTGIYVAKKSSPNTFAGPVWTISCALTKLTLATCLRRFRAVPALRVPESGFARASAGI